MTEKASPRFLIAASSDELLASLADGLRALGATSILQARNLAEVKEHLVSGSPTFALFDLDLIKAGDFKLVRAIRQSKSRLARLPMLGVVGNGGGALLEQARAAGLSHIAAMPLEPARLKAIIRQVATETRNQTARNAETSATPEAGPTSAKAEAHAAPEAAEATSRHEPQVETDACAPSEGEENPLELARELLERGENDKAVQILARVLQSNPACGEAYHGLGRALIAKGDVERGGKYLYKGAECLISRGRLDEAAEAFQELLGENPEAPNPFKNIGLALYDKGQAERAAEALRAGLEFSPEDEDMQLALSNAYVRLGDKERAVEMVQGVLSKHGGSLAAQEHFQALTGQDWTPAAAETPAVQFLEEDEAKPEDQEKRKKRRKGDERRRALRVPLADYFVIVRKRPEEFPVVDMSLTGIGFKSLDQSFQPGDILELSLQALKEVRAKRLKAEVRHITKGVVGCMFRDLSGRQQKRLEAILMAEKKTSMELLVGGGSDFNIGDVGMW